jgi:hypothetical protein
MAKSLLINIYENQVFYPLGWRDPVSVLGNREKFSSVSYIEPTSHHIRYLNLQTKQSDIPYFPQISLPSSWEFEDDSWHIDLTQVSLELCDKEGWMYAQSFLQLEEYKIKCNKSTGNSSNISSIVRQRSWIRRIKYNTTSLVKEDIINRLEILTLERDKYQRILLEKENSFLILKQFDKNREESFSSVSKKSSQSIIKSLSLLQESLSSLQQFKQVNLYCYNYNYYFI